MNFTRTGARGLNSTQLSTTTRKLLAESRDVRWRVIPAAFLDEEGVIRLREPADADLDVLQKRLREGDYSKPFVLDDGVTRRLHFGRAYLQSQMRVDDPYALDLAYTRKMMAFLLFIPRPKHVVIVGLGGGSLTKFCHRQLPRARVTTVEIDEDVIVFGELFQVPGDDERLRLVHADATRYFATTEDRADVVLLDGCDERGIAPAFCDPTFYLDVRARLRPGGMLVMNLIGPAEVYKAHLRFIAEAFGERMIVQEVSGEGNRVAFAFNTPSRPPDWLNLEREARRLAHKHELDFPSFARKLQRSYQRQSPAWGRYA
jgi:spermidine synthase